MPADDKERPRQVIWEVTRACSLSCRTCRPTACTQQHPLELTTPEAWRMVDQVARCHPEKFILAGGDPLRRLNLESLIQYASQKGLRVNLQASATPELCAVDFEELKQAGLHCIAFRLDGAIQERHDRYRGQHGMWHRTMECVLKAEEADLNFEIHTELESQNAQEIEEFAELLSDLRPLRWQINLPLSPGNRAETHSWSGDHVEALFEILCRHSDQACYEIQVAHGYHYQRVAAQRCRRPKTPARRPALARLCLDKNGWDQTISAMGDTIALPLPQSGGTNRCSLGDGRKSLFISHIGEIQPDSRLALCTGNVRTHDLLEVYQRHPLFRTLRNPQALKGKCGHCDFNTICGGSRSRAFAMTGDFLAADPWCIYQPPSHSTAIAPSP